MIELRAKKELQSATGPIQFNIDIQLEPASITAIMGPSGAGKTTLLRIIAGLSSVESGFLKVNGQLWLDTAQSFHLSTRKRHVGMVFQDYALFPNMTVRKNLEFALGKKQDKAIIEELIAIMDLDQLQSSKPNLLSGGQQQRVALARALVRQPQVLLLDEPLSALDLSMRKKLQDYLLKVQKRFAMTTLLVSHDQMEIAKMADHVLLMEQGQILQNGTPADFFQNHSPYPITATIQSIEANHLHLSIGTSTLSILKTDLESVPQTYQVGETLNIIFTAQGAVKIL
ncbi:MAG: ATP-binding cassette domain-containing protein [Bacteroidota bacterium]